MLEKLKSRYYRSSCLSTYDLSICYTTLPNKLLKDSFQALIERTFIRGNSSYLACNEKYTLIHSEDYKHYTLWSDQSCGARFFLLDNIFIRRGTKLYKQIGPTNSALFSSPTLLQICSFDTKETLCCPFSHDNQADVIEAFSSISRYLDDLLDIANADFEQMVVKIYPKQTSAR